jgi:AraC family transcriptional activator of pobA
VARYADRLGLSPERLNRLVRAEVGRSALQAVHDRLVRAACRRLAYVPAPISQIAFHLGFDDPAYFCRFFKRQTGASPSRWRDTQQG